MHPSESRARTAPRGRRIAARLLDELVLIGLVILVHMLLQGRTWLAVSWWVTVVYFFLSESVFGQTIGKNAVGIRVVRRDGGPPETNAVAVRNVVRIIEEPLIALLVLFGTGKRRQRIGDLFAGTTVGLERASVRPHPSPLQWIYPAVWAVLGMTLTLTVYQPHPVPSLGPSSPEASAHATATTDYLDELQALCRERDRWIAANKRILIPVMVRRELRFTRRVASVHAAPFMLAVRRSVLRARRRYDRALVTINRDLRRSPGADQALLDLWARRVGPLARRSNNKFARAGISCRMELFALAGG